MATLLYYLITWLLRPFQVFQPMRGLSRVAYVMLRTRLGRHHASFIGIVEFWVVCLILIVWLAMLRSFTVGTDAEGFFDIWISIPVFACMIFISVWWGLRSSGVGTQKIGPLRDDAAHTNFTGHQARFWSSLLGNKDEWAVLTRWEPGLFAAAGGLLLFLPFTRAAGVLLIAVSIASCFHSWRDFHVNRRETEEEEAGDVPTVTIPFTRYQSPDAESSTPKAKPRGKKSATFEFDAMGWAGLITLFLLVNMAFGDFAGLYRFAPHATESISEGFGRELDVFGLTERNTDGVYPMTAKLLMAHNPGRIDAIRAEQTEALSDDVYEAIRVAREQYEAELERCEEDLPGQLANPPGDAAMHRLFLNDVESAEDFALILNGLAEAELKVSRWEHELAAIEISPAEAQVKTRRALREIKREANALPDALEEIQAARERLLAKLK